MLELSIILKSAYRGHARQGTSTCGYITRIVKAYLQATERWQRGAKKAGSWLMFKNRGYMFIESTAIVYDPVSRLDAVIHSSYLLIVYR